MNKLIDLAIAPIRRAIRQEVGRVIERDEHVRWAIARCARSVTKDFLAELAEPLAEYEPDVPADHLEQSRLTDAEQNIKNLEAYWANERNPS